MQRLFVSGNLKKDAEVVTLEKGFIVKFTVAENSNDYKTQEGELVPQPEFFRCESFRKNDPAEQVKYLTKGKSISIIGKLKTSSWEKEGETKYSTTTVVDEIQFN